MPKVMKLMGILAIAVGSYLIYYYVTHPEKAKITCILVGAPAILGGFVLAKGGKLPSLKDFKLQKSAQEVRPEVTKEQDDILSKMRESMVTKETPVESAPALVADNTVHDSTNPFELYNDPRRDEGTSAIKSACKKAASLVANAITEYEEIGARDAESRGAVGRYLWEEVSKRL